MKKMLSLLLSMTMLFSLTVMTASATTDDPSDILLDPLTGRTSPISMGTLVASEADPNSFVLMNNPDILDKQVEHPFIDLSSVNPSTAVSLDGLDFTNAVNITDSIKTDNRDVPFSEFEKNANMLAEPAPSNQAPVANPQLFVMNEESLRDGKPTTNTVFFLATRWNNVDLCYDPEGGPITLIYNTSFHSGYVGDPVVDTTNGSYAGYFIQMFDAGQYPFACVFVDGQGAASEPSTYSFDIADRGIFQTIEGTLTSLTDSKTYDIVVDFSNTNEYYLTLLRTGTGGYGVDIFAENGEKVGTPYCNGPGHYQSVRSGVSLKKPANVTGTYTYKLVVSSTKSAFVDGDTSFKIEYGDISQRQFFFEGINNSMALPFYHSLRNFDQVEAEYVGYSLASDFGDYYRFTATGTEAVTVSSTHGQHCFRIVDCESRKILYDSAKLTPVRFNEYSSYYVRVDIQFEAGKDYYVNVYRPKNADPHGSYSIMVGEPKVDLGSAEFQIPPKAFVKGTPYEWTFTLQTPGDRTAYADTFYYSGTEAGWPFEDGYFYVMTPGISQWISNPATYYPNINFKYKDANVPHVPANGLWRFKIIAGQTGNYPGKKISLDFWFEI